MFTVQKLKYILVSFFIIGNDAITELNIIARHLKEHMQFLSKEDIKLIRKPLKR